jgi:hypothetical protein
MYYRREVKGVKEYSRGVKGVKGVKEVKDDRLFAVMHVRG